MKKIEVNSFRFISYSFDEKEYELRLNYGFDDKYEFIERIKFHNVRKKLTDADISAINQIAFFMHIACGISYYKALIPNKMTIETGELSKSQAEFFYEFYHKGLGEFAWRNNVNLKDVINFSYSNNPTYFVANKIKLTDKFAVPIGGGKDSTVSLELLKEKRENIVAIAQGRPRPIKETIEVSGVDDIEFTRTICPNLIALNKEEGILNGHVPITGIYAFALALCAVLYDYDKVAMSNERSANVGNLVREDGFEVNHQWSKSLEFEIMFNKFFKANLLENFEYFSLLRPLSELDIASRFAKLDKYFGVFTSCNKAFKIDKEKRLDRWCGECDKCRFVFLALSPFMKKEELVKAVGKNPLDDKKQLEGFEELLGLNSHKPFECVGETEECVVAFSLISEKDEWKNDFIVKNLIQRINKKYSKDDIKKWQKEATTKSEDHIIPKQYESYL